MTQPALSQDVSPDFAAEVRAGLTHAPQKELPSKYLYDEVGSALFEVITVLPEYGVTRAEERLLARHAADIVAQLPHDVTVAELGSGSGRKTRRILEALCKKRPTSYCPIEISRTALQLCRRELGDIERISIVGYERDYLAGLAEVSKKRASGERLLVLFLGSTIGNFRPPRSNALSAFDPQHARARRCAAARHRSREAGPGAWWPLTTIRSASPRRST